MPPRRTRAQPLPARPSGPAQVRIIGGQWKRTPLPVLVAEGLRPTPDRVRETVFNWLHHLLDGNWGAIHCLDLFAGTGALGFEAASRGAARIVMVENHLPAVRQLEATRDKLKATQVEIRRADALAYARRLAEASGDPQSRFDLIFLDPPYRQSLLAEILPLCESLLADGGIVYAEADHAFEEDSAAPWLSAWKVIRADKAGMVFYHLLNRKNTSENQA